MGKTNQERSGVEHFILGAIYTLTLISCISCPKFELDTIDEFTFAKLIPYAPSRSHSVAATGVHPADGNRDVNRKFPS